MDRRGLIIGSLAVAAASVIPNVSIAEQWDTLVYGVHINVSKEWADDLKAHWGIDYREEARHFIFEFPDHIHNIIKDEEWVNGRGFRRIHMHWTITPTTEPNSYDLHSEGYVENFIYTDQGPKILHHPGIKFSWPNTSGALS